MKKFIVLLLSCLSMTVANANTPLTVGIVWPFNIGSTQANYSRALIEVANRSQNRYVFVLENKPGAGSSIAANYAASNNRPTLMAATSSFFIRPNFFPTSSHLISQFTPLMVQCAVPMVVVSKKYKTLADVPKNARITVGVSGLGTTTHLLTATLKKHYPNMEAIPYQGTMAPINDMLGGSLDMAVGFPGELKQFIDTNRLNVLGISGPESYPGMRTFKSQGIPEAELVVNTHALVAPKSIPPWIAEDMQKILMEASRDPLVAAAYAVDDCVNGNVNPAETVKWFNQQTEYWRSATNGIRIN